MKLSYNWLNDFIDLSEYSLDEISEKLTMGAFEVEEISPTKAELEGEVVLGQIEEISPHENADKLQVTKTNVGKETLQIVCGARNIKVGQKVPVALVGSKVVNRHDGTKLEIKKSKIRGVESCGMLCAASELGYTDQEIQAITDKQGDGIYLLADDSNEAIEDITDGKAIGTDLREVLDLKPDYVLEVGARSNRGDALSVYGQAKELSALFAKDLHELDLGLELLQDSEHYDYQADLETIKPEIENEKDTSLFYTVRIKNLKIAPSPTWLQERLDAMGVKSINNIVDISNYVLLELGQPMHFYDYSLLEGKKIYSRRAKAGEKITTLEEKECQLEDINLVIADEKKPVCIAGVMGGQDCSVQDNTKDILLECAVFDAATVRKSARFSGIESESKRRYERGVDKSRTKLALFRAIEMISLYATAEGEKAIVSEIHQAGSEQADIKELKLRKNQIKRLLGIEIEDQKVISLLEKLDIKNLANEAEEFVFSVPYSRSFDITREADLIEEIGRLYGFSEIPAQKPAALALLSTPAAQERKLEQKIISTMIAQGFNQAILSSLIGESLEGFDNKLDGARSIEMQNPLSAQHRTLRKSLIPALIQAASRNYAYDKSFDIKLFELAKVYTADEAKQTSEQKRLAAIYVANETKWHQAKPSTEQSFYELKTSIEILAPRAKFKTLDTAKAETLIFHPGVSATVELDRKEIGLIAKIHPNIAAEFDLPNETYVFEIKLPAAKKTKFKPIANTPISQRDITIDAGESFIYQDAVDLINKKASKDLKSTKLISVYKHADGKQSVSLRLKWQGDETLSREDIDKQVEDIKKAMAEKLDLEFRA